MARVHPSTTRRSAFSRHATDGVDGACVTRAGIVSGSCRRSGLVLVPHYIPFAPRRSREAVAGLAFLAVAEQQAGNAEERQSDRTALDHTPAGGILLRVEHLAI